MQTAEISLESQSRVSVESQEFEEEAFGAFLSEIRDLGGGKLVQSLHTEPILRLIFDARTFARSRRDAKVLNIFASKDASGFRESVYQPLFDDTEYDTVDFWEDKFIYLERELPNSHTLPFGGESFDVVLTTKVLLEHISEPALTVKEIARVLKPAGEAFLIAPFAMAIHQPPHDYFRFTENGLRYLFAKADLEVVYIRPTLSGFMTTVDAFMLFNFFPVFPSPIAARMKKYAKRWIIPLASRLDKRVPDSGRFCRHYICRVRKP